MLNARSFKLKLLVTFYACCTKIFYNMDHLYASWTCYMYHVYSIWLKTNGLQTELPILVRNILVSLQVYSNIKCTAYCLTYILVV